MGKTTIGVWLNHHVAKLPSNYVYTHRFVLGQKLFYFYFLVMVPTDT